MALGANGSLLGRKRRSFPGFFARSPEVVAQDLLGKLLIRNLKGERLAGRIVEVEAYLWLSDPVSHAVVGLTANNAVLFRFAWTRLCLLHLWHVLLPQYLLSVGGPGGWGSHSSAGSSGGFATMEQLRGVAENSRPGVLTGGPDRLCQAMGITGAMGNGLDVTRPESTLQIADDGRCFAEIEITQRVGIRKAIDHPLHFCGSEVKGTVCCVERSYCSLHRHLEEEMVMSEKRESFG